MTKKSKSFLKRTPSWPLVYGIKIDGNATGWAVLPDDVWRGESANIGLSRANTELQDTPKRVAVLRYSDPNQMLEAMPLDEYERRVVEQLALIPNSIEIVRVDFDAVAFKTFLKNYKQVDSHATRAEWAVRFSQLRKVNY